MKEVKNTFDCIVDDEQQLKVSVKFGDGQTGSTYFKKPDGTVVNGDVVNEIIGTGSGITGKFIRMTSVVTMVNTSTDLASVTYTITANSGFKKVATESPDPGDNSLSFNTKITFIK